MTTAAVDASMKRLLEGSELAPGDEARLVERAARDLTMAGPICQLLFTRHRALRNALVERDAQLALLAAPPWYPGTVLRVLADRRIDLFANGRRQIAAVAPDVEVGSLTCGDEVLVNGDSVVVRRSDLAARIGTVGSIAEIGASGVVVRGPGDEQICAACAPELTRALRAGDRVVYAREACYVLERLPERKQSAWVLERPPEVSFERIGGLDAVTRDIRKDLDLHLRHPGTVASFKLRLGRGILLIGGPGVGKTMIAAAIASYVAQHDPETRFLYVAPGAVRGMYYGETEARLREIFAVARSAAPSLVVVFLDEVDSYGQRDAGIGNEINSNVMGALLTEIDGIGSTPNVLCVGATNRLDLCETALVRDGRLGQVYRIPRPGRDATRAILAVHLDRDLPFAEAGDGERVAAGLALAATSYLHAPSGEAGLVAIATLRSGERREIRAADVLSGALLAGAIERAKHAAAHRSLQGGDGLALEDLLGALDAALDSEAQKLAAPHVARRTIDAPWADEIALVQLPESRRLRRHRHLRAA